MLRYDTDPRQCSSIQGNISNLRERSQQCCMEIDIILSHVRFAQLVENYSHIIAEIKPDVNTALFLMMFLQVLEGRDF
jgi:hypothetical protein